MLNQSGAASVRVSEETRQKVMRIAQQMDYRPNRAAQQLRGVPTQTLGVILDTVNLAVFSARLAAIEAEARLRGYRLLVGQAHHEAAGIKDYLDDFSDYGVDCVICLFDVMDDIRPRLKSVFRGHKRVIVHSSPILKNQACVRVETSSAIDQLVAHLVERERKRIALQLWSPTDHLMTIRREAWQAQVKRHNRTSAAALVWTNPQETQKPTREMIDLCIAHLVTKHRADAIIASNDEWAVRLVQGLERAGYRVPEDVAVTGYDNLDIADVLEPGLTTIDQCHHDYAQAVLDLVEAMMQDTLTPASRTRVIQPKLVVREST